MVVYDSKKLSWFFKSLYKTYKYSYNLRLLLRLIILTTIYSIVVTVLSVHYLKDTYHIDPVFFSLIGVILSLFLVYRLNTGYDRWWEGRRAWGKLVNDTRCSSLQLDAIIPRDDIKRRKYFCRHLSNFSTSLVWHLRDDIDSAKYVMEDGETKQHITVADHQPNKIASYLFYEVEKMYQSGQITGFDKSQVKSLFHGFIEVLGICERIKNTPIPFSHSAFINLFIFIYILVLPFGLVNVFGYLTIPGVVIMAFAMLGIEVISEEIENPFGLDANDLPTGHMADTIRDNVYGILNVEMQEKFKVNNYKTKEADILH
jgi:putative membrane protein